MDLGLQGRVALVGGASAGIGRATAAMLAAEGARVVVTSRDQGRISAAADEIGAVAGIAWDSDDLASIDPLVDRVEAELGPVEILVVNTGGPPGDPDPLSFSDEQWEAAHRSLVRSPMALLRRILPGMRERGWGRVINVMSSSVREPIPSLMLSNAERSAALAAFKTLARDVAGDGVTLNCLLPGKIDTARLASNYGSREEAEEAGRTTVPARRLGRPDEMAAAAAFLCSDHAAYITGVALPVDGGLLHGI
jgi:3-oxoacyl-[acyl-carrier protein] reductase